MDYWIIAVTSSDVDAEGSILHAFKGTESDVKDFIMWLMKEDRFENDEYEHSTETVDEIEDNGEALNAYAYYADYHINYTAQKLSGIRFAVKGYMYLDTMKEHKQDMLNIVLNN